jgi:hypothetical protein
MLVGEDTRLQEELLELNEHTALLKVLGLNTLIVDLLELFEVGLLKDARDLCIN